MYMLTKDESDNSLEWIYHYGLSPFPFFASLQIVSWYSFSPFVKSLYTCLYTFTYKLKIVMGLPWERFRI